MYASPPPKSSDMSSPPIAPPSPQKKEERERQWPIALIDNYLLCQIPDQAFE